ncbi:hypothetical protein RHMOL_Rhmol06G0183200 [Rhododendron molle]|uniref:Uncharacterized protein n=1 Tax=Rhododendron molle TaxID=49168 RepID=A0ACC0NF94_RHOML|nr:hypothetical protein RHMOL_Rhmol06G0183200 [Rhododendron molle]
MGGDDAYEPSPVPDTLPRLETIKKLLDRIATCSSPCKAHKILGDLFKPSTGVPLSSVTTTAIVLSLSPFSKATSQFALNFIKSGAVSSCVPAVSDTTVPSRGSGQGSDEARIWRLQLQRWWCPSSAATGPRWGGGQRCCWMLMGGLVEGRTSRSLGQNRGLFPGAPATVWQRLVPQEFVVSVLGCEGLRQRGVLFLLWRLWAAARWEALARRLVVLWPVTALVCCVVVSLGWWAAAVRVAVGGLGFGLGV